MALSDLDRGFSIIHIAGREYKVRYSLNALLYLDKHYKPIEEILKAPPSDWNIECVLQLTRAALCDLPDNENAVINRNWEKIEPNIAELGKMIEVRDFRLLKREIINAIGNSFPKPVIGAESTESEIDYRAMRSLYCDVVGRSDKEFWASNLREIKDRTESYLEVKGLKKPVEKLQMFED